MITLFEADEILVRHQAASALAGTASFELTDAAGTPLAMVRHEAGRGLLGRLFGRRSGLSAADLDVVDQSGARLLAIAKAGSGTGSLNLAVSTADGRTVGSASGSRRDVTLYGPSDEPFGRLRSDTAMSARLHDPDGAEVATFTRQRRTQASGPITYELRFAPGASLALRILAIGTVLASALQGAV